MIDSYVSVERWVFVGQVAFRMWLPPEIPIQLPPKIVAEQRNGEIFAFWYTGGMIVIRGLMVSLLDKCFVNVSYIKASQSMLVTIENHTIDALCLPN